MKKIKWLLVGVAAFVSIETMAQTDTSSKGKVGNTINKIGNKTAQIAVKTTSSMKDKKYASKVGPDGQTIYINKDSKYYYVDARGKKIFISKDKLKDKKD